MKDIDNNIKHKWGFGMSPVKEEIQVNRLFYAKILLDFLIDDDFLDLASLAVSISEIKGLFNRVIRQDQWDWFIVFEQLGFPGRVASKKIVDNLIQLRSAIKTKETNKIMVFRSNLNQTRIKLLLIQFLGNNERHHEGDFLYILSTREMPGILKIGYTTRSVHDRIKEINSATGVLVPFGVRAVWKIKSGSGYDLERRIHENFSTTRIRSDREFFALDYFEAFNIINKILYQMRLELD